MYRQEEMREELRRKQRPMSSGRRVLLYLLLSACATGTIAGLMGCNTYGGRGNFLECFFLYAIPIPMALGVMKVPTQVVGAVICSRFTAKSGVMWGWILAGAFCAGLLAHLGLKLDGHQESWGWFAFITVDLAILAILAFSASGHPEVN